MIKGTARTGGAGGAVAQAAYSKSTRTIAGQALDDPFQQALKVKAFGRREVLEQWHYCLGSQLKDASRRPQALVREQERLCAPVPACAPLHKARLSKPVDQTAGASLRQPDDALQIADRPTRVRLQVDKRSRPAALLPASSLRRLAHAISDSQRLGGQQLLKPAATEFHISSIQA